MTSERYLFHVWPCNTVCTAADLEDYLTFMSTDYINVSMPDEDIEAVPSYEVLAELRAAHPPCLAFPSLVS